MWGHVACSPHGTALVAATASARTVHHRTRAADAQRVDCRWEQGVDLVVCTAQLVSWSRCGACRTDAIQLLHLCV